MTFQEFFKDATPGPYKRRFHVVDAPDGNPLAVVCRYDGNEKEWTSLTNLLTLADLFPRALDLLEVYASESCDETSEEAYAIIDEARERMGVK